jgi:hypothetical protein
MRRPRGAASAVRRPDRVSCVRSTAVSASSTCCSATAQLGGAGEGDGPSAADSSAVDPVPAGLGVGVPDGPGLGVTVGVGLDVGAGVDGVGVGVGPGDGPQACLAWASAALACASRLSARRWAATTACCSGRSDDGCDDADDPDVDGADVDDPEPDDGDPDDGLLAAVFSLASSLWTCRFALASVDCAAVSCAWSAVASSEPSFCPARTAWPGCTATDFTVPLTANGTSASCTGLSVPTSCRAAVTSDGVTVASRYTGAEPEIAA